MEVKFSHTRWLKLQQENVTVVPNDPFVKAWNEIRYFEMDKFFDYNAFDQGLALHGLFHHRLL